PAGKNAGMQVSYSHRNQVELIFALLPRKGVHIKPQYFMMDLARVGKAGRKHWLVTYWAPRSPPQVPPSPDGHRPRTGRCPSPSECLRSRHARGGTHAAFLAATTTAAHRASRRPYHRRGRHAADRVRPQLGEIDGDADDEGQSDPAEAPAQES